jgi:hypothetical protein
MPSTTHCNIYQTTLQPTTDKVLVKSNAHNTFHEACLFPQHHFTISIPHLYAVDITDSREHRVHLLGNIFRRALPFSSALMGQLCEACDYSVEIYLAVLRRFVEVKKEEEEAVRRLDGDGMTLWAWTVVVAGECTL